MSEWLVKQSKHFTRLRPKMLKISRRDFKNKYDEKTLAVICAIIAAGLTDCHTSDGACVSSQDARDETRLDIVEVNLARREAGKEDALLGAPAQGEQRRFGRQCGAQFDLVRVGVLCRGREKGG